MPESYHGSKSMPLVHKSKMQIEAARQKHISKAGTERGIMYLEKILVDN